MRLVAAYLRRFGADEFAQRFNIPRIPPRERSNWLPGGYAWWRERLLGRIPQSRNWPNHTAKRSTDGEA
jgi:hypothetical protein